MFRATYPQVWFTYGPQTKEDDTLRRLFAAGATGVRLTFSYGTPELQVERAEQIRRTANGVTPFIVADLQGEKCRFSKLEGVDEIPVRKGVPVMLTRGEASPFSQPARLPLQLPSYIDRLRPGDVVIEGDGALQLSVLDVATAEGALCEPMSDGVIHPGRGIIVRTSTFAPAALTQKDRADLQAAARAGVFDAVALSFVNSAQDVRDARTLLTSTPGGDSLPIVAKIESPLALASLDAITDEADALMAARGDLALTMPWEELPSATRKIAAVAQSHAKPWILATQVAEGLERFAFPTRAEICDLAHWIEVGAHGVMLSYETAFGPRPIDAVHAVKTIVQRYQHSAERPGEMPVL